MGISYNNIPTIGSIKTYTYIVGNFIPTPVATPANFGDSLEGGYYAGMIWNRLVQTSTSTTIAIGVKTFTVPNMSSKPIVYEGQMLEVRSRANPNNKMVGVVAGAKGTTLTMNITSVGGSGTFSDWSVMARYRIIVAPKATGENISTRIKDSGTALPAACQTLAEGYAATESMRLGGNSSIYPAAHWARSRNINGYTDWYIPARDELELSWRNLKPVTDSNYVTANRPTGASFNYANNGSYGDTANTHGRNNNRDPVGAAYTASIPGQTVNTVFRNGGAEAYSLAYYATCSEYNTSDIWIQNWATNSPGRQDTSSKTAYFRARAVRRSII